MYYVAKQATLIEKIDSVTYLSDQSISVRLETGILGNPGEFIPIVGTSREVIIPADVAIPVLNASPELGLSRRDDIAKSIYMYLLETGDITGELVSSA